MNKSKTLKKVKKYWQIYIFLLIPLVYVIIFKYIPMAGLVMAFKKFDMGLGIMDSPWIGLDNFVRFVTSVKFERLIKNTLIISFYSIIAGFPLPIIFALIVNSLRSEKFKKITQTLCSIPHFISVVVMVGIIMQVLNPMTGLYGAIYRIFHNGTSPTDLLASAKAFPHIYTWSGIWQSFGWNAIVYIACLSNTSQELHEAAQIDGASRFKRVLHIDLPSILPTATIMLIMRMGGVMSVSFEKIYLMQNNLNLSTSEVISTYVYQVGLSGGGISDFSYATAIGLFNSIVNLALLLFVNFCSKKLSETSLL